MLHHHELLQHDLPGQSLSPPLSLSLSELDLVRSWVLLLLLLLLLSHLIVGHALTLHLFMVLLMSLIFITLTLDWRWARARDRAGSRLSLFLSLSILGFGLDCISVGQGKYVSHFINGLPFKYFGQLSISSPHTHTHNIYAYVCVCVIWICTWNRMEIICRTFLTEMRKYLRTIKRISSATRICFASPFVMVWSKRGSGRGRS